MLSKSINSFSLFDFQIHFQQFKILLCYLSLLIVLCVVIPKYKVKPLPDDNNGFPQYQFNSLRVYMISYISVILFVFIFQYFSLITLIINIYTLAFQLTIIALVYSIFIAILQRKKSQNTSFIQSIFNGNKNEFSFFNGIHIKAFNSSFAFILLTLINTAFMEYQYLQYKKITLQMFIYQIMWIHYILAFSIKEEKNLATWEFKQQIYGFGIALPFFVMIPTVYTISGWRITTPFEDKYNFDFIGTINLISLLFGLSLNILGCYLVFKTTSLKYKFRVYGTNLKIKGKPVRTIGNKLLCDGFYRYGRKMNYLGDIMHYLGLIFVTGGFQNIYPYLLFLFVLSFLLSRAKQDDDLCRKKYGKLWEEYCQIAKFNVIPYIY